jgi:cell division protein FtsW
LDSSVTAILFSILVVYSAVVALAYRFKEGDTASYLIKHVFIMGSGIFLMYLVHKVKYSPIFQEYHK